MHLVHHVPYDGFKLKQAFAFFFFFFFKFKMWGKKMLLSSDLSKTSADEQSAVWKGKKEVYKVKLNGCLSDHNSNLKIVTDYFAADKPMSDCG